MRIRRLPRDDDACGWTALLPPPPDPRRLRGRIRADAAVLGAGYTGLAAARGLALHRPSWRIAVLDAQRVGDGASGRNSGFVVDLPHYAPAQGIEGNRRLLRLGRAGLRALREIVQAHAIDCGWIERGRLHSAHGSAGMHALEQFMHGAELLGEPYERLDGHQLAAVTGSSYYRAGARSPGTVMVQPAALARGLARALPENVDLFEHSPVHRIDTDDGFRLEGEAGRLDAPLLLVAANGFLPALGLLRERIFPLMTFASLTRPLSDAEARSLGGEDVWGMVSEMPMGTTLRRLPDRRMLIRNTVRYRPALHVDAAFRARIRERHRRDLCARFPALSAVDFEYTWGGVMGATFNGAQYFGRLAPHLYAAGGYNGVGMSMGTVSGALLADLVVGADSPLLADLRALPEPDRLPPEPALGIGLRATLAVLGKKAGGE